MPIAYSSTTSSTGEHSGHDGSGTASLVSKQAVSFCWSLCALLWVGGGGANGRMLLEGILSSLQLAVYAPGRVAPQSRAGTREGAFCFVSVNFVVQHFPFVIPLSDRHADTIFYTTDKRRKRKRVSTTELEEAAVPRRPLAARLTRIKTRPISRDCHLPSRRRRCQLEWSRARSCRTRQHRPPHLQPVPLLSTAHPTRSTLACPSTKRTSLACHPCQLHTPVLSLHSPHRPFLPKRASHPTLPGAQPQPQNTRTRATTLMHLATLSQSTKRTSSRASSARAFPLRLAWSTHILFDKARHLSSPPRSTSANVRSDHTPRWHVDHLCRTHSTFPTRRRTSAASDCQQRDHL